MEEEMKAMADLERRTDMPKDMGGDPSEKERAIAGTVIRKMMDDSDSEQEYKCISDRSGYDTIDKEKTLSSEMLLAIPNKRESRKYTTYLGRVDQGSSGSIINKKIVEFAIFEIKIQRKPTKWDTAPGISYQTVLLTSADKGA